MDKVTKNRLMESNDPNYEILNRFTDFFGEAFFYYDAAKKAESAQHRITYLRSAILNCVFALEAAANSLIDDLQFAKEPEKPFDRLPILGKYHLFYLTNTGSNNFDYGCSEVQAMCELIKFRDAQVHSKLTRRDYELGAEGFLLAPAIKNSATLALPIRFPYALQLEHGIGAMRSVDKFLGVFLLDWCGLDVKRSTLLMAHITQVGGMSPFPMSSIFFRTYRDAFREEGISLRFLDKRIFSANRSVKD